MAGRSGADRAGADLSGAKPEHIRVPQLVGALYPDPRRREPGDGLEHLPGERQPMDRRRARSAGHRRDPGARHGDLPFWAELGADRAAAADPRRRRGSAQPHAGPITKHHHRRRSMNKAKLLAILCLALVAAPVITGCYYGGPVVSGSGRSVTKSLDLAGFSAVDVSNAIRVNVKQGEAFSVSVSADDN